MSEKSLVIENMELKARIKELEQKIAYLKSQLDDADEYWDYQ